MDKKVLILCREVTVSTKCFDVNTMLLVASNTYAKEGDTTGGNNLQKVSLDKWDSIQRKTLITWNKICRPKATGDLNIIDLQQWNKATILKQLWNLAKKKDKLWITWIHAYYLKDRKPWEVQNKKTSWIVGKYYKLDNGLVRRNWTNQKFWKLTP